MKKLCVFFLISSFLFCDEYTATFPGVPAKEFYKFVGKVAGCNFIGNDDLLNFNVHFIANHPSSPEEMLSAAMEILVEHGLYAEKSGKYYIIKKIPQNSDGELTAVPTKVEEKEQFSFYKLQYQKGDEIIDVIKHISLDFSTSPQYQQIRNAINSLQWVKSTNTLLFKGAHNGSYELVSLIKSLDVPLKQVFIEVLVIETGINHALEFGVDWSVNIEPSKKLNLGSSFNKHNLLNSDEKGSFNLGVIGNIIMHKGKVFADLSSLIAALEKDNNTTILLNQKIMTQENKNSSIFSGDCLPYTGATVQTVGAKQQTSSQIEYRDIGIGLNITPVLGNEDIVSLDIHQEISQLIDANIANAPLLSGLSTSKTNMKTSVHVPHDHFLLLSGMTKDAKTSSHQGLPCLGGLPFLGSIFSKKSDKTTKKNILIFVKPHIIKSPTDVPSYQSTTLALKSRHEAKE